MKISELLLKNFVCLDVDASDKDDAIRKIAECAKGHPNLGNFDSFWNSIYERENSGSTSLGFGVAIPHARTEQVKDMLLVVGRLTKGVEFESHEEVPVRLIFLIGTPKRMVTEYLRLVGTLARHLKSDALREKLLVARNADDVLQAFKDSEATGI